MLFQALREIGPQEELTFQYGAKYFVDAGLVCRCGVGEGGHLPAGGMMKGAGKRGKGGF